jgi:antitoxin MazE
MKTDTLKVVRIGNSRGVRLPAPLLARYRIRTTVVAEQRPEGILLRPVKDDRLSWADTARAMQAEHMQQADEFADFEAAAGDGLETLEK